MNKDTSQVQVMWSAHVCVSYCPPDGLCTEALLMGVISPTLAGIVSLSKRIGELMPSRLMLPTSKELNSIGIGPKPANVHVDRRECVFSAVVTGGDCVGCVLEIFTTSLFFGADRWSFLNCSVWNSWPHINVIMTSFATLTYNLAFLRMLLYLLNISSTPGPRLGAGCISGSILPPSDGCDRHRRRRRH